MFRLIGAPPDYILRYPSSNWAATSLDPFEDLIDWISQLTSGEYLIDLLIIQYHLSPREAKERAKQIMPHIVTALSFIHQSLGGPPDVSFLPAYYAILDLAKVYVLLGSRHLDLAKNKWHGATYNGVSKHTRSLLTEDITLKKGGALALFYETLTGQPVLSERNIKLDEVLPYINEIGAEYEIATGHPGKLAKLEFAKSSIGDGQFQIKITVLPQDQSKTVTLSTLAALKGFRKGPQSNTFITKPFQSTPEIALIDARLLINCRLLYCFARDHMPEIVTAITQRGYQIPQEFPIALLFFYMSSVVRYDPEYLSNQWC